MAASCRSEQRKYDVLLLSCDRTMLTGNADEEAITRSEKFTEALLEYLEKECKLKVFYPRRDVNPGQRVFEALFNALKESKFIVPVMCPAFIQDCWSEHIAESAFLDRLGRPQFIPVCALGVTVQDTFNKMEKYRAIRRLYFNANEVLPKDQKALGDLRRALTASVSQPEQDDGNNEGPGDESNGELSRPKEESVPPCDGVTGGQPPPLLQTQSDGLECQQEGMKTLEPRDGVRQTRVESSYGPHFNDDVRHQTVEGQPQPGPSSPGDNPSQDLPPRPLVHVGTGRDSVTARLEPLNQNFSEGNAAAPEDRGSSSPPVDWYSPVSPMSKTQSKVFQGPNREDRDCEAMGEDTAEERQGQDAVEDASSENSVRGWMGSLSSFLRDVAPVFWMCILCTENSTPQLFSA